MLRENVSSNLTLDTDKFKRALLTHRNTPDRDTGVSPAQVVFGRPIRDFIPIKPGLYQPRQEWLLTRERRELALARRHVVQEKRLTEHTKTLPKLKVSDVVMIQNQSGPHTLKVNTASTLQDQRITEFANQNVEDVISETLVPSAQVINISKLNLILINFLSL